MALSPLQRHVCRLLASRRVATGESYLAGGLALGELVGGNRLSRDVDLFHDTEAAVAESFDADRRALGDAGFAVRPLRERPGFVEAEVERDGARVIVEWARDSSYRFFPLLHHPELGLVLHPFDLATNKVLALVGRREARDWVDAITCHERVQPLGYLAWAASGKDPAFGPAALVELAARNGRYTEGEIGALDFEGERPSAADLSRRWHAMIEQARELVDRLPVSGVGQAVLTDSGEPGQWATNDLAGALARGEIRFHSGSIGGALPSVRHG